MEAREDRLVFCQEVDDASYVVDVNWTEAVGYAWYYHMQEI